MPVWRVVINVPGFFVGLIASIGDETAKHIITSSAVFRRVLSK
jgi:hypothetical protein